MNGVADSKRPDDDRAATPMVDGSCAVDVAIVGAGPTGMMAALGAAEAGWAVALVAPPARPDPRTTALLTPSVAALEQFGVWPRAQVHAAPLATMRLIDATGRVPRAPEVAFDAGEMDLEQFGFNIANDHLNAALNEAVECSAIARISEAAVSVRLGGEHRASVSVPSGEVQASLIVAADGAHSMVRTAAGIGVREWKYDQAAFVTTLSHERSHDDTSTEFHTAAGPFTLVPLPGLRSSLVWVTRPDDAARHQALDPGPLAREIEAVSCNILGHVTIDGPRGLIAMSGLMAHRFGDDRVVLVGEAAHRFPPIGAQGLNLGVRDAHILHTILLAARERGDLASVPQHYNARRRFDVGLRTLGVDVLNRSLLSDFAPVTVMRALGLSAARGFGPLRRALMQFGLGTRGAA